MKKHRYTISLIIVSFFMINCGGDQKKESVSTPAPIPVIISNVTANTNQPFLSVSGKIKAVNSAELSTRMMGFVNKIYAKIGDKVRKGQLLISINNTDLQAKRAQIKASIAEATAAYSNAQKDYNRFKNLFADNSASQKELDDVTANFEMAKARLEAARQMKNEVNAQFAYSNITAPFDGVVTGKSIEVGDMANPGVPLISVETPRDFEVIAIIPENEIMQIKSGTKVDVEVKAVNKILNGNVTEVSTSAKNTGGQYLVKVTLEQMQAAVLSGMFVTVKFPVSQKPSTLGIVLIPKKAIVKRGQLAGVYTVSQTNTALLRWLRLGRTYGEDIEVLSGLSADESYIVSAKGKLFNGVKVSIQ